MPGGPRIASARRHPPNVDLLHFCASPRRFAEKRQAGLDARIKEKTPYRHLVTEFSPAKFLHQFRQDPLQRHSVEGIF